MACQRQKIESSFIGALVCSCGLAVTYTRVVPLPESRVNEMLDDLHRQMGREDKDAAVKRAKAFLKDFEETAQNCRDVLPDAVVETYARALVASSLMNKLVNAPAQYRAVDEENGTATQLFMVTYDIPGEGHILCNGMYKWAAEWLVEKLNQTGEYPKPR